MADVSPHTMEAEAEYFVDRFQCRENPTWHHHKFLQSMEVT